MATCVDIAGADYPQKRRGATILPAEGRSLVADFRNQPLPPRTLAWEHEGNRAIRQDRWKLVALAGQPWELYDVERDPTEMTNRAADEPQRVQTMAADWQAWAERCQVFPKPSGTKKN